MEKTIILSPQRKLALDNTSYVGANSNGSLASWETYSGDANTIDLPNLEVLRNRARDLERNSPVAAGALKTLRTGVIGAGLTLRPASDRDRTGQTREQQKEWHNRVKKEFRLWAESNDCDYYRQQNFFGLQRLAFSSLLTSGDVFVLLPSKPRPNMPYDLRIQLIEADRVCNKDNLPDTEKMAAGISYDSDGIRKSIHIVSPHPGAILYNYERPRWIEVPFYGAKTGRRNVLHIIDVNRIGQSRGVTILAPAIEPLKHLTKYSESELTAAVLNSCMVIAYEYNPPETMGGGYNYCQLDENGEPIAGTEPWNREDNYQIGPGKQIDLIPHSKATNLNPTHPNSQFDPFFMACVKLVAMSLGLPFEKVMKLYQSSYSASRAAMLEAMQTFLELRDIFVYNFCQPIYEEFLFEAVSKGYIQARGFIEDPRKRHAFSGSYWVAQTPGSIDEVKDIKSARERIDGFISSRTIEAETLKGREFEDICIEQAEEIETLKRHGLYKEPQQVISSNQNSDDLEEIKATLEEIKIAMRR